MSPTNWYLRAKRDGVLPVLGDCPRTLAIWKPGVPQPGVNHHFAYSGSMPCTGRLRCTLCGQSKNSLVDAPTMDDILGD